MSNQQSTIRTELILCECKSAEHQVILMGFTDEPEVYLQIHLNTTRNFWQRLWHGLRYVAGYKSRYGNWDELVLGPGELKKLNKFIKNESNSRI